MDAKDAVKRAKQELVKLVADETPTNIGLEEIEFDPEKKLWRVTIGFSRPWNTTRNAFTALSGEPSARRAYRTIQLRDSDGVMLAMKRADFSLPDSD